MHKKSESRSEICERKKSSRAGNLSGFMLLGHTETHVNTLKQQSTNQWVTAILFIQSMIASPEQKVSNHSLANIPRHSQPVSLRHVEKVTTVTGSKRGKNNTR